MPGIDICSSGNARPMPSASMSGMPRHAATTNGIVELMPPAWLHATWVSGDWRSVTPEFLC